jgi:hypothetical protein
LTNWRFSFASAICHSNISLKIFFWTDEREIHIVRPLNNSDSRMVRKIDLNNFRVASSETARDINRRIVLNLVRKHQPVSRADLSRHSGLQRSTVSSIAEQLLAERWVTEGALGQLPRGRKPIFLHLNRDRVGIIAVDLRPLKTTIAIAGLDNHFFAQESIPTGKDPLKFLKLLGGRLCDLMKAHPSVCYEGIGVA